MKKRWAGVLVAVWMVPGGRVGAADGVIEINQAAVLAGNITPGDAAGFPATISLPGSYRLTSNLSAPIGSGAITITAANVTLDLGGFVVSSTNVCTGYPVTSCVSVGSPDGISASQHLVEVRGGDVLGMAGSCVNLAGPSSKIDRVRAFSCGNGGLEVGDFGRVSGSLSVGNRWNGIVVGAGSVVAENESRANGAEGIVATNAPVAGQAIGNRALDNGLRGIAILIGPGGNAPFLVSRNIVERNAGGTIVNGVSLGDNLCNRVLC